jgi:hypothetical protein
MRESETLHLREQVRSLHAESSARQPPLVLPKPRAEGPESVAQASVFAAFDARLDSMMAEVRTLRAEVTSPSSAQRPTLLSDIGDSSGLYPRGPNVTIQRDLPHGERIPRMPFTTLSGPQGDPPDDPSPSRWRRRDFLLGAHPVTLQQVTPGVHAPPFGTLRNRNSTVLEPGQGIVQGAVVLTIRPEGALQEGILSREAVACPMAGREAHRALPAAMTPTTGTGSPGEEVPGVGGAEVVVAARGETRTAMMTTMMMIRTATTLPDGLRMADS